jgi:hypothetical protein
MAPDDVVAVPIGPGTPIGPGLNPPVVLVQALVALEKMRAREAELAGIIGAPIVHEPFEGVENVTGGFRRHYANGTLYMRGSSGTPFFLDLPTAHRYDLLGNTASFLGFPVADLAVDPADPAAGLVRFEHGAIYFWPDIGTIEVGHVAVRYVGFHCFGEADEPSGSNEPYFALGVLPMNVDQRATALTRIYEDIDGGRSVSDSVELYRGDPTGVAISVNLFEHDHGDPNVFKEQVDGAVDKAAEKLTHAIGAIPVVGPALSVVAEIAFIIGGPALKEEVSQLLGTADDHIATVELVLPTKELLRLTRQPLAVFEGIEAHVESPLLSGDGGSYKAYFAVEAVLA